jgi:hypothetical protein
VSVERLGLSVAPFGVKAGHAGSVELVIGAPESPTIHVHWRCNNLSVERQKTTSLNVAGFAAPSPRDAAS